MHQAQMSSHAPSPDEADCLANVAKDLQFDY